MRTLMGAGLLTAFLLTFASGLSAQGRVVVSHDEWLTGSGYFNAGEEQFLSNTLDWFGVGSGESLLIYSSNPFLVNAPFQAWLTGRGISVTVDDAAPSFAGYDAVFTSGNSNLSGTASALASYVASGGRVLAIGGTGVGGPAAEAAYNNLFLAAIGLAMEPFYNGLGTVNTTAFASQGPFGPALFTGVSSIYANNGSGIVAGSMVPNVTRQIFGPAGASGVFAAAEVGPGSVVPEPTTLLLLVTGLLGMGVVGLRRRSRA